MSILDFLLGLQLVLHFVLVPFLCPEVVVGLVGCRKKLAFDSVLFSLYFPALLFVTFLSGVLWTLFPADVPPFQFFFQFAAEELNPLLHVRADRHECERTKPSTLPRTASPSLPDTGSMQLECSPRRSPVSFLNFCSPC